MATKKPARQAKKHFKEIILLLSVPLAIVLLTMAFVYIPRSVAKPTTNLIYCQGASCEEQLTVDKNGTLTAVDHRKDAFYENYQLYHYDAARDDSEKLSLEQAQNYKLNTSETSPEGYELYTDSGDSGFLFWGGDDGHWYLKKGITTKPVSIRGYDVQFTGWVEDSHE